jgi:hypothetical protein
MEIVVYLLIAQGIMGAFDTVYHHELTVALPSSPSAYKELRLHAVRSVLYGVVFGGLAWFEWRGIWLWVLVALILTEVVLTLMDFVEEDRSRKLPATERVIHTILAMNGGALFGHWAISIAPQWAQQTTALHPVDYGIASWLLGAFAIGVALSGLRDGYAAFTLSKEQSCLIPA